MAERAQDPASEVLLERVEHVTLVTLNRPQKRNAISGAMAEQLTAAMAQFDADPEQYVLVLTGAGDVAFSAGADLAQMADRVAAAAKAEGRGPAPVGPRSVDILGVGGSPKPTIAAINGLAVGAGLELALNCDIRISSTSAWFASMEVGRGIMPGVAVHLLPRLIGQGAAMHLMLSGKRMSAEDAYRLGLVQDLVAPENLRIDSLRLAQTIAAQSQNAVQAVKRVASAWRNLGLRESLELFTAVNERLLLSPDVREGTRAFAEKRPPQFKNRWPSPPTE